MKRLIKKIAIFIFLLSASMLALNYMGEKAGDIYKDGAASVCESKRQMVRSGEVKYKKGKTNVLFFGTSRMLAGINPVLFDELSGGETYSYNLALPALPIEGAYFILTDYLANNPAPEYAVLELHIMPRRKDPIFNYYAVQGLKGADEILSLFKHVNDKSILLNYIFPFRMYKYHVPRYIYSSIFDARGNRESARRGRLILERMKRGRGYYYIEEQAAGPGPARTNGNLKTIAFDPFVDPYVELFFDLTRAHKIKVLLVQPVHPEGRYRQYEEMPPHFAAILERYPNAFMAKDGWKIRSCGREFFSDEVHLKPTGADRYTREVYQEFSWFWAGNRLMIFHPPHGVSFFLLQNLLNYTRKEQKNV
jgi:hypothetical protein